MKKIVKITENDIKHMVKESVRKIINEIDWKTSDSAVGKAEYLDDSKRVLDSINIIRDYLTGFVYNRDKNFNSELVGPTKWKGNNFPNGHAQELLFYLSKIEDFTKRKSAQLDNLNGLNDKNFRNQHNGMSSHEFGNSIPDDNSNLTSMQQDYMNRKF